MTGVYTGERRRGCRLRFWGLVVQYMLVRYVARAGLNVMGVRVMLRKYVFISICVPLFKA